MRIILEPGRQVPVIAETDICILGGSCTGVFAAVRAARLGARVVLVERQNAFGGVATSGLVNIWHSLLDTEFATPIIAGLTLETLNRLKRRGAAADIAASRSAGFRLNTEELKVELDELVLEHGITPMLHTSFCAPVIGNDGRVEAVLVENKDGRSAIVADVFIDATGDGDLAARAGIPFDIAPDLQPPTSCAKMLHFRSAGFQALYRAHREEFGLMEDSGWGGSIPDTPGVTMLAETHVFGANCADATQLTAAEIEGRRQMRAVMDLLRKYGEGDEAMSLVSLASYIGIRETRRFSAEHRLLEEEVLWGKRFPDAIANGSYCVDVHHPQGGGFLFKYLDGTTRDRRDGGKLVEGRWREEIQTDPTFYQVPYRCLVHRHCPNVIMAGRMISTDRGAFGAVRVMVNLNQVGEAAGVAATMVLQKKTPVYNVDAAALRSALADGGSIIL